MVFKKLVIAIAVLSSFAANASRFICETGDTSNPTEFYTLSEDKDSHIITALDEATNSTHYMKKVSEHVYKDMAFPNVPDTAFVFSDPAHFKVIVGSENILMDDCSRVSK